MKNPLPLWTIMNGTANKISVVYMCHCMRSNNVYNINERNPFHYPYINNKYNTISLYLPHSIPDIHPQNILGPKRVISGKVLIKTTRG